MAYSYQRGTSIPLAKLVSLLAQLPADSVIWPNESTGNLAAVDARGVYLGYVDMGREEVQWSRPVVAGKFDGGDGFFG